MKTYNIYRYAYEDCKDQITVPDDTIFFLTNTFENPKETKYGTVVQNNYMAILPYSEENIDILQNSDRQSLNMTIYPIKDNLILIHLENVYPLSEDFPLAELDIKFHTTYLKVRAPKQVKNEEKSLEEVLAMSEIERENYIRPVICYIKIHRFDPDWKEKLDVTRINVGSWLDERKVFSIERDSEEVKEVLGSNDFIVVEPSYRAEYARAFNHTIENMI